MNIEEVTHAADTTHECDTYPFIENIGLATQGNIFKLE